MHDFYYDLENKNNENIAQKLLKHTLSDPNKVNMHYGALNESPLSHLTPKITDLILDHHNIITNINRYTDPRGSIQLRKKICAWYENKFNVKIDPDNEIILTNGSIEALVLAILSITKINNDILLTNPTYTLFEKTIRSLNRKALTITRDEGENEYYSLFKKINSPIPSCIIINSPENPTGYVLSRKDWHALANNFLTYNMYVIHDAVLDAFDFDDRHIPAFCIPEICNRSITIGSFSKIFGMAGIRLGWMIAKKEIINMAIKHHESCYVGINSFSEHIANSVLEHKETYSWLENQNSILRNRRDTTIYKLTADQGYKWLRYPYGGLSCTPDISLLYDKLPQQYKTPLLTKGSAVASYLYHEHDVSVAPGCIYGSALNDHIKIVFSAEEKTFKTGLNRLIWNR